MRGKGFMDERGGEGCDGLGVIVRGVWRRGCVCKYSTSCFFGKGRQGRMEW